jgi:hypothetical protein
MVFSWRAWWASLLSWANWDSDNTVDFVWLTLVIVIGVFLLAAVGIWLLVDAFLIPGMIEQQNMKLVNNLTGGAVPQGRATASVSGEVLRSEI